MLLAFLLPFLSADLTEVQSAALWELALSDILKLWKICNRQFINFLMSPCRVPARYKNTEVTYLGDRKEEGNTGHERAEQESSQEPATVYPRHKQDL